MGWLQMESRWPYCDLHNKTRNRRVRTWPMHIRDAAAHKALTHSGHHEAKDQALGNQKETKNHASSTHSVILSDNWNDARTYIDLAVRWKFGNYLI